MNIGTMGAATILMNNHSRMMRGGGGGGGKGPEQDPAASKWLTRVLAVLTVLVVGSWLFHIKPAFWYVTVEQKIVAKQILPEEGNKGRVYDACYIQVETGYVEQDFHWVKKDSTLWIQCNQQDYLNYSIGHIVKEQIVKPDLQGWSTAMTWVVVILALLWTFTLAALWAEHMP